MKKVFYALMGFKDKKTLERKEGDYDEKLGVYYTKEKTGWTATDGYSGSSIVVGKDTKEECKKALSGAMEKLKEIRNSEKYLQNVINYKEMVDDATAMPFQEPLLRFLFERRKKYVCEKDERLLEHSFTVRG